MAEKRKPRKKGQHAGSPNHSDLYTNEREEGTIRGLGFKDAATARKGVATVNKAKRTHAHKVQATLVMKQRAKVAKERAKDPEKKKNLNAAYKIWSDHLEKLKKKTAKKNEGLLRHYVKSMLEFSIKANKKNTHQDGTSKSRGYMSGIDKTWTGSSTDDELHDWYKSMGLMEECIRELLSERRGGSVHPKIYAMINRAEEKGYKVRVGNYSAVLVDSTDNIIAHLGWDDDPMYGPCLNAKHVTNASAENAPGFGPLLYDVAIEVTGGLTPDRTTVSNAARDVWNYYYTARPDVKAIQMDDLTNYLTAEEEDNCEQLSAEEDSQNGGNWDDSVLSRKYVKQGRPVYNELRSRGMLIEK